jgi:soluble lytic murein transglycosylase-like protein
MLKNIIAILAVIAGMAGLPRPASAQIYAWKDANGVLTLSDKPNMPGARIAQVGMASPRVTAATAAIAAPSLVANVGTTYEPLIHQHASWQGIRADLVRAVIQVESAFNARAVSPKGAMGLMQLMPATAAQFGVIDPFNPAENIRAGVRYLRMLLDKYNDNEQLALAAYNAGPRAVDRYGSKVPPYKETQRYVQRITNLNATSRAASGVRIYKVTEVVDGRPVVKYTNTRPNAGTFEEVRR